MEIGEVEMSPVNPHFFFWSPFISSVRIDAWARVADKQQTKDSKNLIRKKCRLTPSRTKRKSARNKIITYEFVTAKTQLFSEILARFLRCAG